MNKEDRRVMKFYEASLVELTENINSFNASLDANSKSIMALSDEVHELAPRYEEIVKLLKKKGVNPIRSFDDLTAGEMEEYIKKLSKFDLQTLKRYLPDDPKVTEKPLKLAKVKDIQPYYYKRNTDNRDETMRPPERRSKPRTISFFGFGKLKVEL